MLVVALTAVLAIRARRPAGGRCARIGLAGWPVIWGDPRSLMADIHKRGWAVAV